MPLLEDAGVPAPILRDPNPGLLRWLLHGVYDVSWLVAIVLGSPWWILRCAMDPAFRSMAIDRLGLRIFQTIEAPEAGDRPRLLLHGVSVGEVKGTQTLVKRLARDHPEYELVISATTDTGLGVARKLYPDLRVVRFPIDVAFIVRRFLRRVAPTGVVLVELEIWPNFLRCANRLGVPIAVANGRITDKSYSRYSIFRDLLPQFNRISLFCVQDDEYARRFSQLAGGDDRIVVTGNIKADAMGDGRGREPSVEMLRLLGGRRGQPVIVAGSTHAPEERWIAEARASGGPDVRAARLLIAPRHPDRMPEILRDLEAAGVVPQRLSLLREGSEQPDPERVVLIDTIGELENVYALADLVFVGGSLVPHGGQNMLEPAALGKPVVFGPHVSNFPHEAELLERMGAARCVPDVAALGPVLEELLADPVTRAAMASAGRAAVESQKGATDLTLDAFLARCLHARG